MAEVKKQGFIYSLRSRSRPDLVYIGSTSSSLAKRKGGHWKDFAKWKAGKFPFVTSFKVIDVAHELVDRTDCYIELVRMVEYKNKAELNREEGIEIRRTNCVNKLIPGRTHSEYNVDNREIIKEKKQKYHAEHREKVNAKSRIYDEKHRVAVNARKREKLPCTCCETNVSRSSWGRHLKSLTHIKNAQQPPKA